MNVLVTGATGFAGGHLARRLLDDGVNLRCLVRRPEAAVALAERGAELVAGALEDRAAVARAVAGCARIFHVAALYRQGGAPDAAYHGAHVEGTRNLLEAARAEGVERLVHVSTVGVHGHIARPPADENAPYNPGDVYQRTKLEGELLARDFAAKGLPLSVVRPAPIYGPGDMRLLKVFQFALRRPALMLGSGRTLYHMIYVDDLVRAFLRAAEEPRADGQVFIAAGPEATSIEELYRRIGRAAGRSRLTILKIPAAPVVALGAAVEAVVKPLGLEPPIYRRRVEFFVKDRSFRTDKARDVLGFTPEVALDDGIARTLAWYRASGHLRP